MKVPLLFSKWGKTKTFQTSLKSFTDDELKMAQIQEFVFKRLVNIVGNLKNAG